MACVQAPWGKFKVYNLLVARCRKIYGLRKYTLRTRGLAVKCPGMPIKMPWGKHTLLEAYKYGKLKPKLINDIPNKLTHIRTPRGQLLGPHTS